MLGARVGVEVVGGVLAFAELVLGLELVVVFLVVCGEPPAVGAAALVAAGSGVVGAFGLVAVDAFERLLVADAAVGVAGMAIGAG